ncbi:MAG TPA: succinylglutamate desuccinylase/aspartoacylase family protein [Usitatibacteraceae bacterium]
MTESSVSIDASNIHFKSFNFHGLKSGPRLIVLGAVHGNETCGTQAILRVMEEIDGRKLNIVRGSVTFVPVANPLAFARGDRVGDRNLNRNLAPTTQPQDFEDHIGNWLCPLLAQHEVLLDLHSTRAPNPPFAMLGPEDNSGALQPFRHAARERALARCLGVRRFVDGWLETYALGVARRIESAKAARAGVELNPHNTDPRYGVGTTEYMRSIGGYAVTLECGSHDDPAAPVVGYHAIHHTLAHLGISDEAPPAPVENYEVLRMFDVIDRAHADDSFSREWSSFDALGKGDRIGTRHDGTPVLAETDGRILFPDAKATPGHEWFYLTKAIRSI